MVEKKLEDLGLNKTIEKYQIMRRQEDFFYKLYTVKIQIINLTVTFKKNSVLGCLK